MIRTLFLTAAILATTEVRAENLVNLPAPKGAAKVVPAPQDWAKEQAARRAEVRAYLAQHQRAYEWFSSFPFSQTDGFPMVLLRLVPELAPEIWGDGPFGASFGLFPRDASDPLPLPVGIGLSGWASDAPGPIDYTSFTCGACHIGRVETEEGLAHIVGGVNSEFNIVKFFVDMAKTIEAAADGTTGDERVKVITARFVQAAKDKATSDPHYFYGNSAWGEKSFDAAYEAAQVQAYLDNADALTEHFVTYVDAFAAAFETYLDKTYEGYQSNMLAGLPGMADATGVSAAHGYETMEGKLLGRLIAKEILPDHPGLTDFMVVWDQDARTARWNDDGSLLVDGGGQYNGNIPIPIYRNLAASMTMGLDNTDIRVAAFSQEFLGGLPPAPYPFDIDEGLAAEGQALFQDNCADCHQPNNGTVYRNLGTDPSRSYVINKLLHAGAQQEYLEVCNPDTVVTLYEAPVKPCAEFKGRPITKDDIMRPLKEQHGGYNATRLAGIWAAAPYLHTGSVPTIWHLLMPGERPDRFVKSALNYDVEKLGFAWDDTAKGGYVFDTTAFHAITKAGHDTDVTMDGKTYRLDWTSNPDGARAIIEYLKGL